MKHTPGPWTANHSDPAEGVDCWWICAGERNFSTELCTIYGGSASSEANARLIATAPELLNALKAMVDWWETDGGNIDEAIDNAIAAIAKAESRSWA